MDIQNALCTALSIDMVEPYDLLDRELSAREIVDLLQDFDFRVFHPEILAEVVLDPGILPDGTTRLLTEKTVKVKGEIWRTHKTDADPWPSNPHAHNLETGIKLHLGTGEMFDGNKHSVGKCSIPDDHIDPRRSAIFMARSVLRDVREGTRLMRSQR